MQTDDKLANFRKMLQKKMGNDKKENSWERGDYCFATHQ